jgi:hypothetical protein
MKCAEAPVVEIDEDGSRKWNESPLGWEEYRAGGESGGDDSPAPRAERPRCGVRQRIASTEVAIIIRGVP